MITYKTRFALLGGVLLSLILAGCTSTVDTPPTAEPVAQVTAAPSVSTSAPAAAMSGLATATSPATELPAPTAASTATVAPSPQPEASPAPTVAEISTPACSPGALTPAQTEGPYYKAGPPEDSTLAEEGVPGDPITITGYVLSADCTPIGGARVDFWQADGEGQYDNAGYTLRGYQVTDSEGRYSLQTVLPGLYLGRTRHIHVKVTPPNGSMLTTQLYFADEPQNAADSIFDAKNVVSMQTGAAGNTATFNFVVGG